MALVFYNTRTRRKEPFVPLVRRARSRMYVCGVTVYDRCHVGHARSLVFFDASCATCAGAATTCTSSATSPTSTTRSSTAPASAASDVGRRSPNRFVDAMRARRGRARLRAARHRAARDRSHRRDARAHPPARERAASPTHVGDGDVYFSVADSARYGALSRPRRSTT